MTDEGEDHNRINEDAEDNGVVPLVNNGGRRAASPESEAVSIQSKDLKVDVKDLINIEKFGRARSVKPVVKNGKPSYYYLMPYCQVCAVVFIIIAVIFLVMGYSYYKDDVTKSKTFKYVGFFAATIGVIAFIAVIYINSVSENSLSEAMKSFRKSRAANPQIDKKINMKKSVA